MGPAGVTNYSYAGSTVTTTDAAGKWKRMDSDSLGNLVEVTEPRPGGGADYVTSYSYSVLGQLLSSSMTRPGKGTGNGATVLQTRTWVYNASTQRLTSVTHPESGTTSYLYNGDGSVQRKTDAKGQYVEFAYDTDGRVTSARRYLAGGGGEDPCARVDYFYGSQTFDPAFTQNAAGRLAATATGWQTGMCQSAGAGQVIEMYSYTTAGAVTKKRMRIIRSGTTVDKDVSYTYGADGKPATVLYPGATVPFSYTYNQMDQPTKMTGAPYFQGNTTVDLVKNVEYGAAGQVTAMQYMQWQDSGSPYFFTQTNTFNELYQLTKQITAGTGGTAASIEYAYSTAGANNGRIVSRKNNERSGEVVSYQYDSLNRVTSATSTVGWVQAFDYDGFGNLWSQTMTGGSATPMSVNLDMSKNRINSAGWGYDNNGNTTAMPTSGGYANLEYDVDNRLTKWTGPAGEEKYGYLPDNKRVWKKAPNSTETYYFYGAGGQKLITYSVIASPFSLVFQSENVYFGGKLIRANGASVVHDRLGSVVARGDSSSPVVTKHDYLPYGEEMGSATSGNVNKFGTYHRDATTGLDYADQRYFAGTLGGRFLSADPYEASGGAANPGSWNRYPYVEGDPVNRTDRTGLKTDPPRDFYPAPPPLPPFLPPPPIETPDEPEPGQGPSSKEDEETRERLKRAEVSYILEQLLTNEECRSLFNTNPDRPSVDPLEVARAYGFGSGAGTGRYGRLTYGHIPVATAAGVTEGVSAAGAVDANGLRIITSANITIASTGHWNYRNQSSLDVARTIVHELGHVFNLIRQLGGSLIVGDHTEAGQSTNAALVNTRCNFVGPIPQ